MAAAGSLGNALVIGAGSGIGRATATLLSRPGWGGSLWPT